MDFLSHPMIGFREAAAELARKDRVLKQSSQDRFAKTDHLLQMSTTGRPRAMLKHVTMPTRKAPDFYNWMPGAFLIFKSSWACKRA